MSPNMHWKRRPERELFCIVSRLDDPSSWGSDAEDSDGSSNPGLFLTSHESSRPVESNDVLPHMETLVHPVLTDFGPDTLSQFLRQEIAQAVSEGKLRTKSVGKGKEPVRKKPVEKDASTNNSTRSSHSYNTRSSRASQTTTSVEPLPSGPLDPDAVFLTRGIRSSVNPTYRQPSEEYYAARRSSQETSSALGSSPATRSLLDAEPDWALPSPVNPLAERSADFQLHTQASRCCTRVAHGSVSPLQATSIDSDAGGDGSLSQPFHSFFSEDNNTRAGLPRYADRPIRLCDSDSDPETEIDPGFSPAKTSDNSPPSDVTHHDDANVGNRFQETNETSFLSQPTIVRDQDIVKQFPYSQIVPGARSRFKPQPRGARVEHTRGHSVTISRVVVTFSPLAARRALEARAINFRVPHNPYERKWFPRFPPRSPLAPPDCLPRQPEKVRNSGQELQDTMPAFSYDIWYDVANYLSSRDVRNLRLACRGFADALRPMMLRSVVTSFGKSMFYLDSRDAAKSKSPDLHTSLLTKHGSEISKFGISFEYDPLGLAHAKPKAKYKLQETWYGTFKWPLTTYTKFAELQELEEMMDNNQSLLKQVFDCLKDPKELALSVDSGHGWLNGPDISDMQLMELQLKQGIKVFGPSSTVEDVSASFSRSEYFKWAQQNTINLAVEYLLNYDDGPDRERALKEFQKMVVREYDSFICETSQPDYDPTAHTGGVAPPPDPQNGQQQLQVQAALSLATTTTQHIMQGGPANHSPRRLPSARNALHRLLQGVGSSRAKKSGPIPLQWPLIFNCYNIAADCGGHSMCIQDQTANPTQHSLIPRHLTEAQVQWLMETVWAQRAFLSSYTTAVITQKHKLTLIHTLTIAKISSGLLPSLAQREFWTSLPGLTKLKILVSPDWRNEHIPGDKYFATHMLLSPAVAASKFTDFLRMYIAKIETLSHLTVGYAGGGEHASGIFARNLHILPAPITEDPHSWATDHLNTPDPDKLLRFDHIRDLFFENCWFSPCMLEKFMEKSRDTSLHTLTLDSVSMLARHEPSRLDGPLTTVWNALECKCDEDAWLYEQLPHYSSTWTQVLDKITPGITMIERKFNDGMVSSEAVPEKEFRGNIQKIILKSCGYAMISVGKEIEFNQNMSVTQSTDPIDVGLHFRRQLFSGCVRLLYDEDEDDGGDGGAGIGDVTATSRRHFRGMGLRASGVMMSMEDTNGNPWFGLGKLTQCIHPIEKRVLEKAWGLRFGWGDDLTRFASVEDGCFEGGTGRFSGEIGL